MAVKFKEVKTELESAPLTTEEKGLIDDIEKYIDKIILENFDNSVIRIELNVLNFNWNPIKSGRGYQIKDTRKKLMRKELERRYTEAGWKFSVEMDDGLDGPNRSGPDYWVLKGK